MPRTQKPKAPATRDRLKGLEAVAKKFEVWRPATDVLTRVSAVPTCFVQVDRATRVGGWPLNRISTIHGPSNHGKTAFLHGLGLSFLSRGHFYGFVDGERTTPAPWLGALMGAQARNPAFVAMKPDSFEQTVDAVRNFFETIAKARDDGDIPDDTMAICGVDSIRKLIPQRLLDKILKEGADGKDGSIDGMKGRGAQYKAALQSQWMDELVPLLDRCKGSLVVITREADDPNASAQDLMYGKGWQVQGSKSLIYEASLVIRITREGWVRAGSSKDDPIVGERHLARVWKTKIGGKEDKHVDAYFHTANGVDGTVGFDPVRDLVELAIEHGIITQSGSWYSYGDRRIGQGAERVIGALREAPELVATIEAEARAAFAEAT